MFNLPKPTLQTDFANALARVEADILQPSLFETLLEVDVDTLDTEISNYVPKRSREILKTASLRAEIAFPLPCVLQTNPFLLGYYRLLYGFSQKEFFTSKTGVSRFKKMETDGVITKTNADCIDALCKELCIVGDILISELDLKEVSRSRLHELSLLTLGPQFRGGKNVAKGMAGIARVFDVFRDILSDHIVEISPKRMLVRNAAQRKVEIAFAADPDIVVKEEMPDGSSHKKIAVEVKAGSDFSNIHNRVGEAEKSHQKARADGFTECWTVINVDKVTNTVLKSESPSTDHFYRISQLVDVETDEYKEFRMKLISLVGVST